MAQIFNRLKRTHSCGQLEERHVGQEVVLMGWVNKRRNLGGLIFIDLRDREGITQIVFDSQSDAQLHKLAEQLRSEYVVAVVGDVIKRPEGTENPEIFTGRIEVRAKKLEILNTSRTPPLVVASEELNVDESLRLKYRYLDLRRPRMYKNILLRHRVTKAIRDFFDGEGFIEVETPLLIKSTPEGARDYLVPSRIFPSKFYALPQSPQLFKQILMVAGIDRYFQIARCMRDEDLRADRQPEFTQIDVEMAFVEYEDVLNIIEHMLKFTFAQVLHQDIEIPFPRLDYHQAMEEYGTDKPDMRYDLKLIDITDVVKATEFRIFQEVITGGGRVKGLRLPGEVKHLSRKELEELSAWYISKGGKGLITVSITENEIKSTISRFLSDEQMHDILNKMGAKKGDTVFLAADLSSSLNEALGRFRIELARRFGLDKGEQFKFVWIVNFPLFSFNLEENRFDPEHHPFTMPLTEDIHFLDSDPLKVRANAYDLVMNGVELGGGSIRIHQKQLQEKIFRLIGLSEEAIKEKFGFLLEAFEYGAPPHGGIALGLDRLVMLIANEETIREVIAFPKNQSAVCLMTDAPVEISPEQLKYLGIKIG